MERKYLKQIENEAYEEARVVELAKAADRREREAIERGKEKARIKSLPMNERMELMRKKQDEQYSKWENQNKAWDNFNTKQEENMAKWDEINKKQQKLYNMNYNDIER